MLLALLLCAGIASAAEIRAVRFHTKPEHVFVNQPFELWFEIELPLGCEAQDLRFSEFPESTDTLSFEPFAPLPKLQRKAGDGKTTIDVLRFKAQALATVADEVSFRPCLHGMITERTGNGFFSSSVSRSTQRVAEPFTLTIQSLPETGKPENFSGAVGTVKLEAQLSSATAQPGDLLTLSVSVTGDGDLRNVAMPVPQDAEGFKVYPVKEKTRKVSVLQSEQVFIPQSTNALEIGAIRFSYFNPVTRNYEEAVAGPFRITFTDASVVPKTDAVRVIDTASSSGTTGQGVTLEQVNHGIRRFVPMLVFGSFALVACFVFFQLYGAHTRIGIVAAVVLLDIGGGGTYRLRAQPEQATRPTTGYAEVRFAPSANANVLFVLHPDTPVTPIETAGDWVRIDSAGRRGWMPSRMLDNQ